MKGIDGRSDCNRSVWQDPGGLPLAVFPDHLKHVIRKYPAELEFLEIHFTDPAFFCWSDFDIHRMNPSVMFINITRYGLFRKKYSGAATEYKTRKFSVTVGAGYLYQH